MTAHLPGLESCHPVKLCKPGAWPLWTRTCMYNVYKHLSLGDQMYTVLAINPRNSQTVQRKLSL